MEDMLYKINKTVTIRLERVMSEQSALGSRNCQSQGRRERVRDMDGEIWVTPPAQLIRSDEN